MEEALKLDLGTEEFDVVDKLYVPIERHHEGDRGRKKGTCKCIMCGVECRKGNGLLRHVRTHTGERPFKCSVSGCGVAFTTESNLKCHSNHKHSDKRSYKCDFPGCLRMFKTAWNLTTHQKSHSDERPFACPSPGCSFRAKFSNHVKRHMKSVHSEAKTFACSKCDYETAQNDAFTRHMRRHSSRRCFKCSHPQCKASFKSPFSLKRHFNNSHGDKNIQCDRSCCGHLVTTKAALKDHLKLQNSKGRVFQCPLCLSHYTRLDQLQADCAVHTNEKPFQCGHCKYEAATGAQSRKHMSSAHSHTQIPFIVHLLDDRECLRCKLTLPSAEFVNHCKDQHPMEVDHTVIESRLDTDFTIRL